MITVTGSLAFDHIMDYAGRFADNIMPDKIHKINLSFLLSNLNKQKGGTAGNIAYTLSLLKTPVSIFAPVGEDFDEYLTFLKDSGVDTSNIRIIPDKKTASAFIMTDKDDNQITGFYPGAMEAASSLSLKDLAPKPTFVIISPNDPKAILKYASESQQMQIPYVLDIGMQLPALGKEQINEMLQDAEILIGNDYEISLLKEKTSLSDEQILHQVKVFITTLGKQGSIIQTKDQKIAISAAKPTQVLDPTGAGDAYRSGFLAGYLKKFDLKTCGQMGSVASCYVVEEYGTTNHRFSLQEFVKRYKDNFGEEIKL